MAAKKAKKKAAKKTAKKKAAKKPVKKAVTTKTLVGKAAPAFSMPMDDGGTVSLKNLKGQTVVLYFYPKDDTTGCTAQACAFRDDMPRFKGIGATIIGVSKDNIKSHQKFKAKYNLNFPLASDEDGKVCAAYGVWKQKSMYGRTYMGIERSTFIIDKGGLVRAEWRKVSVPGHAAEVKAALQAL